ncbi:hypothetical protein VTO42DRAFT_5570 [Malbranchea cinnamomea]
MPHFPENTGTPVVRIAPENSKEKKREWQQAQSGSTDKPQERPPASIQVKNRRKRYLELHPEYFGPDLELADPLLYDRLVRRFQTAEEREAEGRAKGFSGVLEADLMRSELKMEALANPDSNATFAYTRGPNGEILEEDQDEIPASKEEGFKRWKQEMELRFLRGADLDFDYSAVDDCEDYDDWNVEQEKYFDEEEPEWLVEKDKLQGETGIQDF